MGSHSIDGKSSETILLGNDREADYCDDWDAKIAKLKKRENLALRNFHHISWSKQLLDASRQKNSVLDLHGTDLSSKESIEHLLVLLPLDASTTKTLNMR